MKKLLIASLFLILLPLGCNKNKASEPAPAAPAPAAAAAPAAEAPAAPVAAAPAAPAAPAVDLTPRGTTISLDPDNNDVLKTVHIRVAPNGPIFGVTAKAFSQDAPEHYVSIVRTDIEGQEISKYEFDGENVYFDDFNNDDFTDIAFPTVLAEYVVFAVLLWNKASQTFDEIEIQSFGVELPFHSEDKTFTIPTKVFGEEIDGDDICGMRYRLDGTKFIPAQKARPEGSKFITVTAPYLNKEAFPHLDSLTFEFREEGNDVKAYVFDCDPPVELFTVEGATIKDMKDSKEGDDYILSFMSRESPDLVLNSAEWNKETNLFELPSRL